MRSLPSKRRNGFTALELLVVMVILAVLLGGDRNLTADTSVAAPNILRNGGANQGPLGPAGSFQILVPAANAFPVNAATRNFGFTTRTHDGSVQQVTSARLREAVRDAVSTTGTPIQWSLPN